MAVRGIRGATTVQNNEQEEILAATKEILQKIVELNPKMQPKDLGSAIFTMTTDLNAVFPARAARELGWTEVPLICTNEIPVQGSLPKCIRVLLHWNTELSQPQIHHVYLREARKLRPDIVGKESKE